MAKIKTRGLSTDIQLINVASQGDMHNMADFPYGMALITSYLRQQGIDTLLLQYPLWKKEEYLKTILDCPAYLYGFQVGTENYANIRDLVEIIKENNPEGKIVYGGPFLVSMYEELLRNDPHLDAVVLGEGEYTIAELIKLLKDNNPDWKLIRGIAWLNEDDGIVVNPHREAIDNMDIMPFAARDGVEDEAYDNDGKYMHDVRITTSRGCTSSCTFCAVNVNSRMQKAKRWRGRDPISVVDEMEEIVGKYNVKLFNFQDSAFDDPGKLGQKRSRAICEEIIKRGLEVSIKVYYRAHPVKDGPDDIALYRHYKEAGIDVIIFGVEAGSNYELELYGKTARVEDNYRCLKIMHELDLFFCHVGIIMFGPYSTFSTLRENYRFMYQNQLFYWYCIISNSLIVTPGAAIYNKMKQEGRIIPRNNYWEYPDYEFRDLKIKELALHYQHLRAIYPHIDLGSPLVLKAENIITRLKNKMNKKVAASCKCEIEIFKDIYYKNKKTLNELGYHGTKENLERIEKDGLKADLVSASEPYFGKSWESAIYAIEMAYLNLIDCIQAAGFSLGGLVYDVELTKRERRTNNLESMGSRKK